MTAVLVLTAGLALLYFRQYPNEPPPPVVVPLTSYPGLQLEPSFSPDGTRVAFCWNGEKQDNFDIYLKPIGPGAARRVTTDASEDRRPVWAPEGNRIAFQRGGFVYLVSPEGGSNR